MYVRPYTFLDYPTVKEWADKRKFPLVPPEFLPPNGFIIDDCCVCFVYRSETPIAWLEWVISNPDSDVRDDALNLLIEAACDWAKGQGFKVLFTSVEHKGLIERYKSLGFIETDRSMTNLLRNL